jgi:hypothetical protein
MKRRFYAQHKIIPVTFGDAMMLLFSNDSSERNFMIHMWCLLKIYSEESLSSPVTDLEAIEGRSGELLLVHGGDFPNRYSYRCGPVPIHFGCEMPGTNWSSIAPNYNKPREDFTWTINFYRYAILALRAVSSPSIGAC